MLWPEWVVPITGSTGAALHAACPFQPFLHAIAGAIPVRLRPRCTYPSEISGLVLAAHSNVKLTAFHIRETQVEDVS
jgi:hypothetical protein